MKKVLINTSGKQIYGQRWQNTESSSDSESEDHDHQSLPSESTDQISGMKAAKRQSTTITTDDEDKEDEIPKGKRVRCGEDGELMYRAALQGDWIAAEVLLERDPNLAIDYITEEGDRALHVAAMTKNKKFVEKLVERMSDLTLVDGRGYTACCYAAISGKLEIAGLMIDKNPNLATLHDDNNAWPLHLAALRGDKEMLSYLLESTQSQDLPTQEWFDLLLVVIRGGRMYDMAMKIIEKDGSITTMFNEEGTALHLLAGQKDMPNVGSILPSSPVGLMLYLMIDYGNDGKGYYHTSEYFSLCNGATRVWRVTGETMGGGMQKMEKGRLLEVIRKPRHILHGAAKAGKVELITMLIRAYPQLIWDTDSDGYTIFHIAVKYRQIRVFNLVHEVNAMIGLTTLMMQDDNGNNILHLAAIPAAVNKAKLPLPLQMQNEILWFKEVEEMVPPCCVGMENKRGLKPRELFSKTHKRLLKESEMWMKNTADSCMLIATILLTVVFTAAFTVPGGYGTQTGEPVLAKSHWFKVFLVFEVLGFISAVASITTFRIIMASNFSEEEFLYKLPFLQMVGIQALVLSLVGAFSAFMSSISLFNLNINALVWFGFCTLYFFGGFWVFEEIVCYAYRDNMLDNYRTASTKHSTLFIQGSTTATNRTFSQFLRSIIFKLKLISRWN